MREGARRPEFSQHLSRTIVLEGAPTRLECKVSGCPAPEVRWLKDRRSLGDDVSYEATCEEAELYALCVGATYSEHAGWYSCVARNDVGTAVSEAKLTVERAYHSALRPSRNVGAATHLTRPWEPSVVDPMCDVLSGVSVVG